MLATQFDAQDAADYANQMKRFITPKVDAQTDLSGQALCTQYDHMRIAHAAIIRMGQDAQPDSALCVFCDNALPQAYSTVRQLMRQKNHATFAEHFREYVTQVRADLSSRQASAVAHAAAVSSMMHAASSAAASSSASRKSTSRPQPKGNGLADVVCLRCFVWTQTE